MANELPSDSFYLVHAETGQRYPVRGEIHIGRSHGDIVFAKDPRLSSQHCRLVSNANGLMVYDLDSGNGTYIDGVKLVPDTGKQMVPGSTLQMGEQEFTLQILSIARLVKPRRNPSSRKKKKAQSSLLSYLMLLALFGGAFYAFSISRKPHHAPQASNVPLDALREMNAVFAAYDELQSSLMHERAPISTLTSRFEKEVVLPLQGLSLRLSHTQLENTHDQIMLDVEKEYAASFSTAVHDYTTYLQTGETQYLDQMDIANDQMDQMNLRFKGLSPTTPLPTDLRSPQRLVEREMRKAFKTYREIGESMAADHLNKKQSQHVRETLLPQLQAVLTRMGGVAPESPGTRKRLEAEQRLVSSVIGQLKAVLLYAESREAKYNVESEHWLVLIQKNKNDLKDLVARRPAALNEPQAPPPASPHNSAE